MAVLVANWALHSGPRRMHTAQLPPLLLRAPRCTHPAAPSLCEQALRLIMHLGEPLPEARPAWEFPLGATLPFFLLTFAIMCYTNGVGASTGGLLCRVMPNCSAGQGVHAAGLCHHVLRQRHGCQHRWA